MEIPKGEMKQRLNSVLAIPNTAMRLDPPPSNITAACYAEFSYISLLEQAYSETFQDRKKSTDIELSSMPCAVTAFDCATVAAQGPMPFASSFPDPSSPSAFHLEA